MTLTFRPSDTLGVNPYMFTEFGENQFKGLGGVNGQTNNKQTDKQTDKLLSNYSMMTRELVWHAPFWLYLPIHRSTGINTVDVAFRQGFFF